jgi:iron-sulfur cluster repair protein YtfE (RIC family)
MYRKQHAELVEIVQAMAGKLDQASLANSGATEMTALLKVLAGKLLVHLAAEDYDLYPKLIASSNRETSTTAKQFQDEMGGLKGAFKEYYQAWGSAEAIQGDPGTFIEQTQGVFEALGTRVERENTILYPLADTLR